MVGPIRRAGNAEDIGDVELSAHRLSRRVRSVRFAVAIHRDTVVAAEATYGLLGPAIGDGRSVDLASVVPNRVRALPYPQRAANGAGRQHPVSVTFNAVWSPTFQSRSPTGSIPLLRFNHCTLRSARDVLATTLLRQPLCMPVRSDPQVITRFNADPRVRRVWTGEVIPHADRRRTICHTDRNRSGGGGDRATGGEGSCWECAGWRTRPLKCFGLIGTERKRSPSWDVAVVRVN